jgi:hypothetical protein
MTSGEVTHRMLRLRPTERWARLGNQCIHITWGHRGAVDVADLDIEVTTDADKADFILAHGTEALGIPGGRVEPRSMDDLKAILKLCGELGSRPMVIANPDIVTVSGCGKHDVCMLCIWPSCMSCKFQRGCDVRLLCFLSGGLVAV